MFAVDSGLLMPDDARFTPIWMLEDAIAAAYQMEGAFNDLSVKLEPGANEDAVGHRSHGTGPPPGPARRPGRGRQLRPVAALGAGGDR